jgi:virginiamycin B lyase
MKSLFEVPHRSKSPLQIFIFASILITAAIFSSQQGFIDPAFAIPPDQTTTILSTWTLPTPSKDLSNAIVDFAGNIYFTETSQNKVGKLDPATNTITEWSPPINSSRPTGIGFDALTGNIYFAESGSNRIGRLVPATNIITEWTLPSNSSNPSGLATDPESGIVFFGENGTNKVGRLDPSAGTITEWTLPSTTSGKNPGFSVLRFDPGSGNLYFLENNRNTLGRLAPSSNTFTEWSLSNSSVISGLTIGFEEAIYFTESSQDSIARLEPATNTITEWTLPANSSKPTAIGFDPTTGSVYYTASATNKVGRLVPATNAFTEWAIGNSPLTISVSPAGSLYYIDTSGIIGRLG